MVQKVPLLKLLSFTKIKQSKIFSFLRMKSPLPRDIVEISQKVIRPPKDEMALKYFQSRNIPTQTLFVDDVEKEVYSIVKKARKGDEEAIAKINKVKKAVDNAGITGEVNLNDDILNSLAHKYSWSCRAHPFNQPLEYNGFDYHRIYRTIGQSEYDALMKGEHIVSPECENLEVFVTNKPSGYFSGKQMPKGYYFVTFKDKDNFDLFLKNCFNLDENFIPNIHSFNKENAEYLLKGGYNINDVETIKTRTAGRVLYKSKS